MANNYINRELAMKIKLYKIVLEKKAEQEEREQLLQLEGVIDGGGLVTAVDKRKFIQLKAVVNKSENCLGMADSMFKFNKEEKKE